MRGSHGRPPDQLAPSESGNRDDLCVTLVTEPATAMAATGSADSVAIAAAASLGLAALAELVAGTKYGICVLDDSWRYIYSNPAACGMFDRSLDQLQGQHFLFGFPEREHATMRARLPRRSGEPTPRFTCVVTGDREVVCSIRTVTITGRPHSIVIFRDVTGPRAAARIAASLSQTTAMIGTHSTNDVLVDIARHAVNGTAALACGIDVIGDDDKLSFAGGYGFPFYPSEHGRSGIASRVARSSRPTTMSDFTGGAIRFGDVPGKPVVEADARVVWEANPAVRDFALTLRDLDWSGAVYVPLSWENRTFGFMCVYLPAGIAGPTETELAFYTALADQAAVAIINGRLTAQAAEAGSLLERSRLAREMHDSVSQALFSMTMHARAAQLLVTRTGVDETGPLARSLAQLVELTRGALAEMRALIFELRPKALVEEGMIAALRKQAAVFADREQITITVDGPDRRLNLEPKVEEHFYRIVSEALHNVIKHAQARHATVIVTVAQNVVHAVVTDDGIGFDPEKSHPGHLGLRTMQQRAETIGAQLDVTSNPHTGTTITITTRQPEAGAEILPEVLAARTELADETILDGPESRGGEPNGRGLGAGSLPPAEGGASASDQLSDDVERSAFTAEWPEPREIAGSQNAETLGLSVLAEVVAGAHDGIIIVDRGRRFVYANPAACRLLGRSLADMKGRDLHRSLPVRQHAPMFNRLCEHPSDAAAAFTCAVLDFDGMEREVVCSAFAISIAGQPHGMAVFRDVTGLGDAARAATALAQSTAGLLGNATTPDILTGIARHAVNGTEGLACDIIVVNDEHEARVARALLSSDAATNVNRPATQSLPGDLGADILRAMTQAAIRFGDVPGKPVVEADARVVWEANPAVRDFALTLRDLDWSGAVYVPLSWENRTFGFMCVYLPAGIAGPTETELAFYTALADQAAVAIINGRLTAQAAEAGSLLERSRLAREMHDSVSQALFSMTMHARAAQLLVTRTGVDETGPLARSLAQLVELTRGALAEMRALIFELRPKALVEEGMIAALRKQAAVFADREQITITVDGPDRRLNLEPKVEEHFYRIVSEALHNVIKHAQARHATVIVTVAQNVVHAVVTDDGIGFDPEKSHPGHLGLRTMQQRAETIGAQLDVTSNPHTGTTITITTRQPEAEDGPAPAPAPARPVDRAPRLMTPHGAGLSSDGR